jgi:2-polyprenyl-6-methoxyphenol hydroxylase-like FAD-dependent oxidoreductase
MQCNSYDMTSDASPPPQPITAPASITHTGDVEVIIAGGGPVGLCTALLLAEQRIPVTVVEAEPAIVRDLRASTFHPPTLDMLEPLGITPTLIERGLLCPHWQIRLHPSGDRAVFDLSVLNGETRHPYRLQCEQWKLSEALLEKLRQSPHAQVRFAGRVEAAEDRGDHVRVEIEADGKRETLRGRYVVGADGARSTVRHAMGLPFEGMTYPETTLLVTTLFPFEEHLESISNVSYCWKENGNFSLLKVPGRWRVSIYPDENIPIEEQMTPEALNASLQIIVPRNVTYDIAEQRPYRVHMRMVPTYRAGRMLLAGDAAHLNTPAGGMGLNGGIHDAFELAARSRARIFWRKPTATGRACASAIRRGAANCSRGCKRPPTIARNCALFYGARRCWKAWRRPLRSASATNARVTPAWRRILSPPGQAARCRARPSQRGPAASRG